MAASDPQEGCECMNVLEAKELYGDKLFSELDDDAKKQLWAFRLSVIRIENKSMDEIRKIFYRVNLTNYSLNDQEKRHSNSWGKFADLTSLSPKMLK